MWYQNIIIVFWSNKRESLANNVAEPISMGLIAEFFFFCKQNYNTVIFIIFKKLCSFKQTPF